MRQPMPNGSQDAFRYPVARSGLMTYETSQSPAPSAGGTRVAPSGRLLGWNKVPEVTVYFWIIKVLCTTVGETAADLLNEKAGLGLTGVTVLMSALLAVVLVVQCVRRRRRGPRAGWRSTRRTARRWPAVG